MAILGMAQEAGPRDPQRTLVVDGKTIRYRISGDLAVSGDIILGNAAELEAYAAGTSKTLPRGAAIYLGGLNAPLLWPNGTIPYTIAAGFPNQQRILDAVAHWNARTPLKLEPRAGQTNYVQFQVSADGGCLSTIGMAGGRQTIDLGSGCPTGAVIHEIGHAFGLMHEQTRLDRDRWITVLYENIDDYDFDQFHQSTRERDLSYYDYGSIMHYSNKGFSLDGGTDLETVPPGIPIGQIVALSAGDIDGISRTYGIIPTQTTITTIPEGLTVTVDGERFVAPRAFNWAPGTTHTISVEETQQLSASLAPTREVFVRWSDGGGATHTFTASADQTAVAAEFQEFFKVTTSVSAGSGTVSVTPPSPDGYYRSGTIVKIAAAASNGQALYTWRGSNPQSYSLGYSADVLTIPLRRSVEFNAEFSALPMALVDATPSGSTVLIDNDRYYTPVRFKWTAGSTHTLAPDTPQYSPTAASKFVFRQWEDGSDSSNRSVQMGSTAVTFSADYAVQHFLNYSTIAGSGLVSANPSGSAYYDAGTQVTLTASPRFNQRLQYWLGTGIGGGALNQTISLNRPKYAFAVFGSNLNFRPTNAASYLSNVAFDEPATNVAPLEIVTLFGTGLGPTTLVPLRSD
jgi:astacin